MPQEYPSDWDSRRRKVYRRDNFTCQNCGAKGGPKGNSELQAHHIVPKSKGGTHKLNNLKTMCIDCHNAIHGSSMAPTAQDSAHSTTRGFYSRLKDVTADASFQQCPLCDSNDIGTENVTTGIVGCANCGVEFDKRGHGFEIVSMNDQLLHADLPINYSKSMMGYSLRPSLWQEVGSAEDVSELNFDSLEEKSKIEEEGALKTASLTILIVIGIYLFLLLFTDSVQSALLLGFAVTLPVLLFVGRKVSRSDIDPKDV